VLFAVRTTALIIASSKTERQYGRPDSFIILTAFGAGAGPLLGNTPLVSGLFYTNIDEYQATSGNALKSLWMIAQVARQARTRAKTGPAPWSDDQRW